MHRSLAFNQAGAVYRHLEGAMIPYRLRGKTTRATIVRIVQLPLRAGLAAVLAQAIAVFLGLPYPAFAMVAAILVTDLAPEQSRQLGLRRIGGTLIGAALGGGGGAGPGAPPPSGGPPPPPPVVAAHPLPGGGGGPRGGGRDPGATSLVDRPLHPRRDVRVQPSAGGGRGSAGGVHQRGRASVTRGRSSVEFCLSSLPGNRSRHLGCVGGQSRASAVRG